MFFPPTYPPDQHVNDFRFATEWDWEFQRIDLRIIHFSGLAGHVVAHGQPVVMAAHDPYGGERSRPTFSMSKEQAQDMMDQLWRCGCRPTEAAGSAGSLAATQKHLDDMRAIAFAGLNIPPNERSK